jgi:hypothetical protein
MCLSGFFWSIQMIWVFSNNYRRHSAISPYKWPVPLNIALELPLWSVAEQQRQLTASVRQLTEHL